jgi:hypothetical protein
MLVFNHIAALWFIFIVPFSVKVIAPKIKTPALGHQSSGAGVKLGDFSAFVQRELLPCQNPQCNLYYMQAVFDQLIFPLQRIDPVLLVLLVLSSQVSLHFSWASGCFVLCLYLNPVGTSSSN